MGRIKPNIQSLNREEIDWVASKSERKTIDLFPKEDMITGQD